MARRWARTSCLAALVTALSWTTLPARAAAQLTRAPVVVAQAQPNPAPSPEPVLAPPVIVTVPDTRAAAQQRPASEPVTNKWWFWAAVGGVLVVTITVLAVASSAPDAPATRLGDMEAFRNRP